MGGEPPVLIAGGRPPSHVIRLQSGPNIVGLVGGFFRHVIYHQGNLLGSICIRYSPLHRKVKKLTLPDSHVSRDFARVHSEP